jgi:hypothetical protein
MNKQLKAIRDIHRFFTSEGIPYVLIGGIALQQWGEPRFTQDIDVTILVDLKEEERIVKKILSVFSPKINNALDFALKHRICLVQSKEGHNIDISLGIPGYEEEVIRRARDCKISKTLVVKICSAEDLIIHKAVAGRPRDLSDIEGIIIRQGKSLDTGYIRRWLREFSNILESKEVFKRFEKPWKRLMKYL